MTPTLGGALARGLAGYLGNRRERQFMDEQMDAREQEMQARRERERLQDERQSRLDALQQEQVAAQLTRQREQDQRQAGIDIRSATEGGYRPVGDRMDDVNKALGIADQPTVTIGGMQMRKSANSNQYEQQLGQQRLERADTEATERKAAEQRQSILNQLPASVRAQAGALPTAELQKLVAGQLQRTMTPKEPSAVSMQVIQTADGPMAFNPRTGQAQPITSGGRAVAGAPQRTQLPTEGERKAAALFGVAQQGYETLESLITTGVDPKTGQRQYRQSPSLVDKLKQQVGLGVGNVMTSDQQRQTTQAAQQMADMWLRYTSGAAVPETEVARFAQTFTPLPGDDPQTAQQKAAARKQMIGALQQAAGRALQTPGREGTAAPMDDPGFLEFLRSRGIQP